MKRGWVVSRVTVLGALLLAVATSACIQTGGRPGESEPVPDRSHAIVIGAFNFTESRILAEIYKQALENTGLAAEVVERVATREIMEPALEQGQVDVVPEYLGTAFEFLGGTSGLTSGAQETHEKLREAFALRGITVLRPAPGQNRNEVVVTRATADRYGLERISDLASVDGELILGGPPECPSRPLCLPGLEGTYGLFFESFHPLDSGGPLTLAALEGGEVDVAILFTTDPALQSEKFVVLRDDKRLQPSENVVPVVRDSVLERHGSRVASALNLVTAHLTNDDLRGLNARSTVEGETPVTVARAWLASEGLL